MEASARILVANNNDDVDLSIGILAIFGSKI